METQTRKQSQSASAYVTHFLLELRRLYAAYGRRIAPNGLADVVHDGGYSIPADVLAHIDADTPDYESIFDYVSDLPTAALHLIVKLAEGRAYEEVLDPCAGSGLLLSAMVDAGVGKHGMGVVENPIDLMLAGAISADLPIEWVLSRSANWLETCSKPFDLIICAFPFGSATETVGLTDINGETIKITDERGRLILLQSALRMTARGVGIFVVPNLDSRGPASGVYHNLHRFGLAMDAFFALAQDPKIPVSKAANAVVVIRRTTNQDIFVAKMSGDSEHDETVIRNYQKRKKGSEFGLGVVLNRDSFRGWSHLAVEERIRTRAQRIGYTPTPLRRLATAINLTKASEPPGFEDLPNCVYLPGIGRGPALSSVAELTLKPHNYIQIVIDPEQALAAYVAEFLNTPLGLAIREGVQSGFTIPKITKASVESMNLYLPPGATQSKILKTQSQVRNIRSELQELEERLWSEPRKLDLTVHALKRYMREESFTDWLDTLPFPLASILWTYHTAGDDQKRRYEHLMHFFEALAQFMATILLSAIERDVALFATEKKKLVPTLREQKLSIERASFGTWKCIFEQLAKTVRSMYALPDTHSSIEQLVRCHEDSVIRMLTSSELVAVIQRCTGLRNTWIGHAGVVGDRQSAEWHNVLQDELSRVRDAFGTAWDSYNLVLPGKSLFSGGTYRYALHRVMGRCAPFEQFEARLAEPLEHGYLHLLGDDEQTALRLMPLVRVMPSPASAENACYFYNRQQTDGLRFVSYHFEQEADIVNQFPDTLAAISSLDGEFNKPTTEGS